MYKILEVSTGKAVEVTERPLQLTFSEVKCLEENGFRCVRVDN